MIFATRRSIAYSASQTRRKRLPTGTVFSFWAREGQSLYPNMAHVAQVILSVTPSVAVLEGDFSKAGRMMTGSRRRLSGRINEITLFLRANKKYIPIEVPTMSDEQAKKVVHRQLTNPRAKLLGLSTGAEDVVADVADEYKVKDDVPPL